MLEAIGDSMILRHLLLPDILDLVEAGRLNDVREFLAAQPAPEIAELLTALEDRERVLLFRLLNRHLAGEVFSLLETPAQDLLLKNMAQEEVRQVIADLSPDDRTALFEELPAQVTKGLLSLLSDDERKRALTLLSYPDESVGRLMTDRYVTIDPQWTAAQALDHLRAVGTDSETLTMTYVVDAKGRLTDELRLRKLILAQPDTPISKLLDGHFAALAPSKTVKKPCRPSKNTTSLPCRSWMLTACFSASSPPTTSSTWPKKKPPKTFINWLRSARCK